MCIVGIDGDIIRYTAAFAAQHTYYWIKSKDGIAITERLDSHKEAAAYLKEHNIDKDRVVVEPEVITQEPFQAHVTIYQLPPRSRCHTAV